MLLALGWVSTGRGRAAQPTATGPAISLDESAGIASIATSRPSTESRSTRRPTSYKVIEVKNGGTITGAVNYIGKLPAPRKIQIAKDRRACGGHPTELPRIRCDADGRVAQAVVFLTNITKGKDFPRSRKKPSIDQRGCAFEPPIQLVRAGQEVEILNSDPVAHNINATQGTFTLYNIRQPRQGMRATLKLDKPGLVSLRCNLHEWMQGYVHVTLHPYIQVTPSNGVFRLEDVPPGTYELTVWQEYLGEQTFPVEVKAGTTSDVQITLKPKPGEEGGAK